MTSTDHAPTHVSLSWSAEVSRRDVGQVLREKLSAARGMDDDREWRDGLDLVERLVLGSGKRTRPLLCLLGWAGCDGGPDAGIVRVAAALEMFHTFALIHDDVMDMSAARRGFPTLHVSLADRHRQLGWRGDPDRFGESAAILWGDLCLVWADELFHSCSLPLGRAQRALSVYQQMRAEVLMGQYLDVKGGADTADLADCFKILLYKSARYTVERPLQIGAALAGAEADTLAVLSRYGIAVGEAFQLRDDVLGVFGNAALTGKSTMTDLSDGKSTVLMALTRQLAKPSQAETIRRLYGDPDLDENGADALREIISATGALQTVEEMIMQRTDRAVAALDGSPLSEAARAALTELARTLSWRHR